MAVDPRAALQDEGFLSLLADAIRTSGEHIQGFLYAKHHVIRDVSKPWGEQELWRLPQMSDDDYQLCHDKMMKQIEIEKLRIAIIRALSMMDSPWPGQEKAPHKARLAFGELITLTPES